MPEKIKKAFIAFIVIESILILTIIFSQKVMVQKTIDYIKDGKTEEALSLMKNIHNIDSEGKGHETILAVACECGNKQVIFTALEYGADPNKQYGYLLTPLEYFCSYGYEAGPEPLQKLLSSGADINKFTEKPAIITLASKTYYMNDSQKATATQEINLLFKSGAKLSYNQESVMHYAAKSNMAGLVSILIQTNEGIQLINTPDADGNTPYQLSIKYGSVSVQRVIREYEDYIKQLIEEKNNPNGLTEEELINQLLGDD